MLLQYNVQGDGRKALVREIEAITEQKAEYEGTPTFAYQIGKYRVTRNGELVCEHPIPDGLINALEEAGFEQTTTNTDLVISYPTSKFTELALLNLQRLVRSKSTLIKHALGINNLPIEITEETVSFPWFGQLKPEETTAYTHFIDKLVKLAMKLQRVTCYSREYTNERYSFRGFLLKLGFIGKEYKTDRRILLQNLSGNASYLHGPRKEEKPDDTNHPATQEA